MPKPAEGEAPKSEALKTVIEIEFTRASIGNWPLDYLQRKFGERLRAQVGSFFPNLEDMQVLSVDYEEGRVRIGSHNELDGPDKTIAIGAISDVISELG